MKFKLTHKKSFSKIALFFLILTNTFFGPTRVVFAVTGGPDTYGYTYADSAETGITYSWNDISATGASVGTLGDDSIYGPFNIGFTYNFYGTDYTQFYVCNNGYIAFNNTCAYSNASIPSTGTPNNFIAPFWDDLYTAGSIKYLSTGPSPNGQLVVSWLGISHYNAQGGNLTFQIVLFESSNKIMFQYQDVDVGNSSYNSGASATVGIENSDGTDGLQRSFDSASLSASYAIQFYASPSYTQSAYRFFSNANGTDVGSALAAQNTATTVSSGAEFRLRVLIHTGRSVADISTATFKLQFADKGAGTCIAPTGTYADVTTSTAVAYKDNTTPSDGAALTSNANDPTHSSDTIVNQTYEELNNATNSQAAILAGQDGKWDFSLYNYTMTGGSTYCLRIVKSDASALSTYTVYPEITATSSYITYSISSNTINLGSITPSAVASSSHTVTVSTNASGGYILYVSEDGNLRNGANDINDVADGTVTAGSEEYGLNTGYNEFASDAAITSSQKIARSTGSPVDNQVTTCTYEASVTAATTGTAYSHTVEYVVVGTF